MIWWGGGRAGGRKGEKGRVEVSRACERDKEEGRERRDLPRPAASDPADGLDPQLVSRCGG